MSIIYNYFDFATNGMVKGELSIRSLLRFLPKDQHCKINTNIRSHCGDNHEFIIYASNGKIMNEGVINKINAYVEKNNSRSYFYEGLVAHKDGCYSLYWGS